MRLGRLTFVADSKRHFNWTKWACGSALQSPKNDKFVRGSARFSVQALGSLRNDERMRSAAGSIGSIFGLRLNC
jgi:hypothetical protein